MSRLLVLTARVSLLLYECARPWIQKWTSSSPPRSPFSSSSRWRWVFCIGPLRLPAKSHGESTGGVGASQFIRCPRYISPVLSSQVTVCPMPGAASQPANQPTSQTTSHQPRQPIGKPVRQGRESRGRRRVREKKAAQASQRGPSCSSLTWGEAHDRLSTLRICACNWSSISTGCAVFRMFYSRSRKCVGTVTATVIAIRFCAIPLNTTYTNQPSIKCE